MQIETLHTATISVMGMVCGGCVDIVTRALVAVDGVHDVQVSLALGDAVVQYDEQFTSPDKLKAAVATAGYGVVDENNSLWPEARGCSCK